MVSSGKIQCRLQKVWQRPVTMLKVSLIGNSVRTGEGLSHQDTCMFFPGIICRRFYTGTISVMYPCKPMQPMPGGFSRRATHFDKESFLEMKSTHPRIYTACHCCYNTKNGYCREHIRKLVKGCSSRLSSSLLCVKALRLSLPIPFLTANQGHATINSRRVKAARWFQEQGKNRA